MHFSRLQRLGRHFVSIRNFCFNLNFFRRLLSFLITLHFFSLTALSDTLSFLYWLDKLSFNIFLTFRFNWRSKSSNLLILIFLACHFLFLSRISILIILGDTVADFCLPFWMNCRLVRLIFLPSMPIFGWVLRTKRLILVNWRAKVLISESKHVSIGLPLSLKLPSCVF